MGIWRTYSSFWQTHPTPFFYRWVKVLVTAFRVMVHNPVKLSSVASRNHSLFPQVRNYGCGTRRIWKITLNLIMVGPRALMFLSSISRHNDHLSFCFQTISSGNRIFVYLFLPFLLKSRSFLINRLAKSALQIGNAGRFWSQICLLDYTSSVLSLKGDYDFALNPLSRVSSCEEVSLFTGHFSFYVHTIVNDFEDVIFNSPKTNGSISLLYNISIVTLLKENV